MSMINSSECEFCKYGTLDEANKAKIMVYCAVKDKRYIYGQCIPCDDKLSISKTEKKVEE